MLESLFNKVAGLKEHILKNRCKQLLLMLLKLYRCIGTIDERFGEISYDTVAQTPVAFWEYNLSSCDNEPKNCITTSNKTPNTNIQQKQKRP